MTDLPRPRARRTFLTDLGRATLDHDDHIGGIELAAAEAPDAVFRAAMPDLESVAGRVDNAEAVADGDTLLGVRVVATPGHTLGHLSAFEEDTGLLLVGDALVHDVAIGDSSGDGIEVSPSQFTADMGQALASVAVLAELRPASILFGHGEPLREGGAAELTSYAESI